MAIHINRYYQYSFLHDKQKHSPFYWTYKQTFWNRFAKQRTNKLGASRSSTPPIIARTTIHIAWNIPAECPNLNINIIQGNSITKIQIWRSEKGPRKETSLGGVLLQTHRHNIFTMYQWVITSGTVSEEIIAHIWYRTTCAQKKTGHHRFSLPLILVISYWMYVMYLLTSFGVTSLALGQFYGCTSNPKNI